MILFYVDSCIRNADVPARENFSFNLNFPILYNAHKNKWNEYDIDRI